MSVHEESDISPADEPIALFRQWFAEARQREPNDPDAMALATVDASGLPDVRMVLLKSVDRNGFVFYTNLESAKGEELAGNPQAALCFHWKSLGRQVRVRGTVMPVSDAIVLSTMVDGVVYVVRAQETPHYVVKTALAQLRTEGTKILGVLLNRVDLRSAEYKDYYEYYGGDYHSNMRLA